MRRLTPSSPSAPVTAPEKPAFGAPCNGCGYCCAAIPCGIATEFIPGHPTEGPCQAMEFDQGRFFCGMMRRPSHYMGLPNDFADHILGGMIAEMLGAGRGCDADDFPDMPDLVRLAS